MKFIPTTLTSFLILGVACGEAEGDPSVCLFYGQYEVHTSPLDPECGELEIGDGPLYTEPVAFPCTSSASDAGFSTEQVCEYHLPVNRCTGTITFDTCTWTTLLTRVVE